GAVEPPDAAAPVPTLRKFGRRARIIELSEDPAQATSPEGGSDPSTDSTAGHDGAAASDGAADSDDPEASVDTTSSGDTSASDRSAAADGAVASEGPATQKQSPRSAGSSGTSSPTGSSSSQTAVIDRDADGVELGELSVTEAPSPRPAPRFEGTVLHRAEGSGSRSLIWLVWALVAVALVVLVILLLTGVLGPGEASALDASVQNLFTDHLVFKEPAA
ncbi:MAG: hypothetical protein ACTH6A_16780, partial [Brachybacterium tyrofermentans]